MPNRSIWRLLVALSVLTAVHHESQAATATGDLLLRQAMRKTARSAVPDMLMSRRTLDATSLRQLVQWTAPVAKNAPQRYGDFASYWVAANRRNQRTGKTFEAVLASRANEMARKRGLNPGYRVTAVEGFPSASSDLVLVSTEGQVLAKFQAKLNLSLRSASRYLADPRYTGQTLLTTRESHARVVAQLEDKELSAARRGILLDARWQRVRDAVNIDQLPGTWAGKSLPTRKGLAELAEQDTRKQFERQAARLGLAGSRLSWAGAQKVVSRGLYVVDLASIGYLEYRDIDRYLRHEISAERFATKSGIRGVQVYLATYALSTPELVSKAAVGAVVVVVLAVDFATDLFFERIQQREEESARQLLASIERSEQYHAARSTVLATLASR